MRARDLKTYQAHLDVCRIERNTARVERDTARAQVKALRELARDKQREVDGLRKSGASELARYQEHLSQKVRALEANKVTIADMNLELKQLRESYDAKRDLALRWQNAYAGKVAELDAAERKGKARIDSPKNWALLNQRDAQWSTALIRIAELVELFQKYGPTPPGATIYHEVPDPVDGRKPGDPVPGGNGVWYNKRRKKARKK